jgi:hypothetical protein
VVALNSTLRISNHLLRIVIILDAVTRRAIAVGTLGVSQPDRDEQLISRRTENEKTPSERRDKFLWLPGGG